MLFQSRAAQSTLKHAVSTQISMRRSAIQFLTPSFHGLFGEDERGLDQPWLRQCSRRPASNWMWLNNAFSKWFGYIRQYSIRQTRFFVLGRDSKSTERIVRGRPLMLRSVRAVYCSIGDGKECYEVKDAFKARPLFSLGVRSKEGRGTGGLKGGNGQGVDACAALLPSMGVARWMALMSGRRSGLIWMGGDMNALLTPGPKD